MHYFRINFILILCIIGGLLLPLQSQILSPKEFLVTSYGKEFTPHHHLVAYTQYLAENSPYMKLETYGYTYEKRPLLLAYFSTPENISNIENIRKTQLHHAGLEKEVSEVDEKAIVWFSYSVHGNEPSGSEASMSVMYELAAPDGEKKKWLENTIVIIDPSVNPDGYDRYTHWIAREGGKLIHPDPYDREHMEPWPGGRVNHYLFDLNRDWAWQTQVESEQRMAKYNDWFPHVHADVHEMGYNSHYYFAPAAAPYHSYITDFQREFQVDIGRNHTRYFDKKGWIYFTRESFDLFYPSYGDTYPTYHGAIGMTYEKGGIGAGRAILMNNLDTLTLADRIEQQKTASLSTIEISSYRAEDLITQFKKYFKDAAEAPKGQFKTYVIKASENQKRLADLFDKNRIDYAYSSEKIKSNGYHYPTGQAVSFDTEPGDMIISAYQPKSVFLQVLMEPQHQLEDSLTYDITAWSLPMVYGVDAYGVSGRLQVRTVKDVIEGNWICRDDPYAYYFKWGGRDSHRAISKLLRTGMVVRKGRKGLELEGKSFDGNYIFILQGDNKHIADLHQKVSAVFDQYQMDRGCVGTGFTNKGLDLGGRNFSLLKAPKVMTFSGDGVSANGFGQIWHFFENHLVYPLSIVDIRNADRIDLTDYDILILPDGYYSLNKAFQDKLDNWLLKGGKVIAVSGALRIFADKEGYLLKEFATEEEKKAAEKEAEEKALSERFAIHEGSERRYISNMIPGAVIRNVADISHPLAFGLEIPVYFSLKTSSRKYSLLKNAANPVYIPEEWKHYGFIGSELKKKLANTVTFAVENKGRGSVIYMVDNPMFRGFWESGHQIFANALFMVD
ncbi:MAG TPA: M14 family metallopeptidase [Saprospiraceae bacterium]|mgnify:FL=1|nr:M14 family metallopeptidase [Saprospiraceae bacterium]